MFFSLLSRSVKNDKTKTWSRNEFDREIQGLLNVRLPVSMSKIKSLREVALNHGEHRNYILQSILRFIENAPPDYRTTGLYVINYIIKRAKTRAHEVVASEYRQRFSVVLYEGALDNLFSPCTDEDKIRVMKVLRNWRDKNLYSEKVVERVRKSIMQYIPPNAEDAWRRGSQQDLPCRADSEGRESMSEEAVKYFLAISTASASNAYSFTESLHTLHPLAMPSQSRPNNLHPDINPYYNPPDVAITDPNFQPMDSITPALAHFLFSVSCNNNNIPVRIGSCNAGSSGSETDRARDPSQEAREETEARSTEITDHSESIDAVNRNQAETDLCVKTEPVQLEKEGVYLEKMEGNNEEDKTADIHQQVPLSKNDSIPEAESFTRAMSPASIGTRSMAIDSKPSLSEVMEAVATNAIPPLPKTPPPPPSNAMLSISHQREASNHSQTAVPLSFENSSIAESNAFPVSSKAPRTPPLPASNIPPPTPPPTPKTPPLPPSTPSSSFDPPAPKTPPLPPSIVATNPSSSPTRTCSLPPPSVPTSKRMTSSPAPKTPRLLPQSSVSLDQEKLVSNPPPPKTPPLPPSDNRVTCNNPSLPPTAKTPPLPPVRNQQVANLSRLGTPPLPSGTREEICWPSLPPPPPRTPPLPSNDTVKELAVPAPPKTPPLPPNGAQLLPPPPKTPPLPPAKDEKHTSSAPPPKTPPLPAIGSSHISVPRQSELPPVHSSLKLSSPAPISPEQKQRNSLTECNKSSRRDTRPCDHEQPTKQLNADDTSCYPARHQGDQLDTQQERSSKPSWWDQRPTEYTEQEEAENKNNKKAAADSPSLLRKRQAELPYSHPYHSSKVSRWDQKQS